MLGMMTSLGGTNGAVVIDLKHLQQFSMDNTTLIATIVSNPSLTRKLVSTLTVLEDSMVITGTFFGTEEE